MRSPLLTLSLLAGTVFSTLAAPALAQDKDPLAGPKVKDNSVPGQQRQFGGAAARQKGEARPLPPGAFMRALASLESKDAPSEVLLTEEQRTKISQIRSDFEAKIKAYKEEHADELQMVRDTLPAPEQRRIDEFLRGPRGGEGMGKGERGPKDRPEGDQPPPPPATHEGDMMMDDAKPSADVEAARAKARELLEGAPRPADAQQQVMAILTEAQKSHVKAELDKFEKERSERREGKGGPEGRGGPDGERPAAAIMEKLTQEEREALKNMKPEERREFLRKKAQELGVAPGKGKGGKRPK